MVKSGNKFVPYATAIAKLISQISKAPSKKRKTLAKTLSQLKKATKPAAAACKDSNGTPVNPTSTPTPPENPLPPPVTDENSLEPFAGPVTREHVRLLLERAAYGVGARELALVELGATQGISAAIAKMMEYQAEPADLALRVEDRWDNQFNNLLTQSRNNFSTSGFARAELDFAINTNNPYYSNLQHFFLGTNYSLHHRLTELQTLHGLGKLAVINKCGVPQFNSGSHEEAQQHIRYGMPNGRGSDPKAGWMKRIAEGNTGTFNDSFRVFDRTGGSEATLGAGAFRPLAITNLASYGFAGAVTGESNFRVDSAFALLGQQEHNTQARDFVNAYGTVENSVERVRVAVQGTTFSPAFPTTSLGSQLKDAFIAFMNFDTRLAYTEIGGFDLHSDADPQGQNRNNPMGQSNRMKEINDAIAAFRLNCERVGIWGNTAICINTEFGRTNAENGAKGLDHADAHVCFVMGGAVRGGIYGDAVTVADISRPQNGVEATTSSLDVYNEIVQYMGLSTSPLILSGYSPRALGLFV